MVEPWSFLGGPPIFAANHLLDCFLAASCTCNDLNLCKSSSIRGQLVCNSVFFLLFNDCSGAAKYFDLFLTHVEMVLLGTPYFSAMSLFERPFSRSLKA